MRICRECNSANIKIEGVGSFEDTIIVHCLDCGEGYEIEPDGFGEGGLEMVEAMEIAGAFNNKEGE